MRYFELAPDPEISNPIQLQKIDKGRYKNGLTEEEFRAVPDLEVGYFQNSSEIEILDILQEPAFLISDTVKRVFALYEPEMLFRGIQLFAREQEDMTAPLYWLPWIPQIECLSAESRKYANGMLEKLVLCLSEPMEHEIFRVAGIMEHKVIISMAVAESLLRRKVSGFRLIPVPLGGNRERFTL